CGPYVARNTDGYRITSRGAWRATSARAGSCTRRCCSGTRRPCTCGATSTASSATCASSHGKTSLSISGETGDIEMFPRSSMNVNIAKRNLCSYRVFRLISLLHMERRRNSIAPGLRQVSRSRSRLCCQNQLFLTLLMID
ncbi:hypothetical protein ACJJTC_007213, partial [Scirpophaga incertulas]